MSANKYKSHLLLLPEDDAYREMANGFIEDVNLRPRAIDIAPPLRGWRNVLDVFKSVQVLRMQKYSHRRIALLIDLDNDIDRLATFKREIPRDLADRVFVLGVLSEAENLKKDIGKSFEEIGKGLAKDCVENSRYTWGHALLRHNEIEVERMMSLVKPFLFVET